MNRAVLPLLCGVGLCLVVTQARADYDVVQIANLTFSGGVSSVPYGPNDFPIASDVTLNFLKLTESFTDGTTITDPILNGIPSLGSALSGNFILDSASFFTQAHGGLQSLTLTGETGPITVDVYTSPGLGGTTAPANILPIFTATFSGLTTGGFGIFDLIAHVPGQPDVSYAAGTVSLVAADVPEPGTVGLLIAAGAVSLLSLRRRSRRA